MNLQENIFRVSISFKPFNGETYLDLKSNEYAKLEVKFASLTRRKEGVLALVTYSGKLKFEVFNRYPDENFEKFLNYGGPMIYDIEEGYRFEPVCLNTYPKIDIYDILAMSYIWTLDKMDVDDKLVTSAFHKWYIREYGTSISTGVETTSSGRRVILM